MNYFIQNEKFTVMLKSNGELLKFSRCEQATFKNVTITENEGIKFKGNNVTFKIQRG